jgi:hypothetical protein
MTMMATQDKTQHQGKNGLEMIGDVPFSFIL